MVSLTVVFAVVCQLTLVYSDLCVLEPLVTISHPLCVQQQCNNSTNNTTRNKRNSPKLSDDEIKFVPPGSPSAGHFPSVEGDDEDIFESPDISNRFAYNAEAVEIKIECNDNYTYRSIDGSCNNLKYPEWGKSSTPFLRMLCPRYSNKSADGIAVSVTGNPLPLPRVISTTMFPDLDHPWNYYTLSVMQWGQLLAHDMGLSPSASNRNIDCCLDDRNLPVCYPIVIPKNDSFYSQYNQTCQNLIRTKAVEKIGCNCKKIPYQINSVTHYIDLSHLYGSSELVESSLRQFEGGLLEVHLTPDLREFPKLSDNPASDCGSSLFNITCFRSGDKRVNQNTELTCLQTILLREHNRIAKILTNLNTNWTDETLYQEARKINIAQFQHISYNEWMPLILGNNYMKKYNLKPLKKGYTQYRSDVNVGTFISFMTGAYRIFHSQIQGKLKMYNQTKCPFKNFKCLSGRCPYRSINISDYMNRPGIIVEDHNLDSFLLGLTVQQSQKVDRYYTSEPTYLLVNKLPKTKILSFILHTSSSPSIYCDNFNRTNTISAVIYATKIFVY